MKTIKILFIDPAQLFRKGFALYLTGIENIEVIHDINTIDELKKSHLKNIDLILFDTVADSDFRVLSKIQKERPHISLVALSAQQRIFENYLFISTSVLSSKRHPETPIERSRNEVEGGGGRAFLSKKVSPEIVVNTIEQIALQSVTGLVYPENIREQLFGEPHMRESFFSDKELNVLGLLGKGKSTQEAAEILNNSKRTVETHRRRMIERIGCKNIIPVIMYALNHNYLRNEAWE